jgi:hypothetical protein
MTARGAQRSQIERGMSFWLPLELPARCERGVAGKVDQIYRGAGKIPRGIPRRKEIDFSDNSLNQMDRRDWR